MIAPIIIDILMKGYDSMVELERVFSKLSQSGINFFTGVPDSLLNDFCIFVDSSTTEENHILAANEGNAIAIAVGHYLSTREIPLVYMQNAGLGNCVNPLISLTHKEVYHIPMILLIGWRGDPEIFDWPQHKKQGEATLPTLELLDIPYKILDDDTDMVIESIDWAKTTAQNKNQVVALVAKKNVFSKKEKDMIELDPNIALTRHQVIGTILDILPLDTIYIASTGRITRELYFIREERRQTHDFDFLNVGAMGHTVSIALGIALSSKNRLIVCLDGDAAAIMHLGSMAIAAQKKPDNLIHIILNNGVHESVGGQKSIGQDIDFTSFARSIGYVTTDSRITTKNDLQNALRSLYRIKGAKFIDVRVVPGMVKKLPPLDFNHIESKNQFMNSISIYGEE